MLTNWSKVLLLILQITSKEQKQIHPNFLSILPKFYHFLSKSQMKGNKEKVIVLFELVTHSPQNTV